MKLDLSRLIRTGLLSAVFALRLPTISETAAASEFINLDFNSPKTDNLVPTAYGHSGPINEVFYGWTILRGNQQMTSDVGYGVSHSFAEPSLQPVMPDFQQMFGSHRMAISGPLEGSSQFLTFRQRGIVPAGATELGMFFLANTDLRVKVDGKYWPVNGNAFLGTYRGLDVTSIAGTEVTLDFVFRPNDNLYFDITGFKIPTIPEPTTVALAGAGIILLCIFTGKWP